MDTVSPPTQQVHQVECQHTSLDRKSVIMRAVWFMGIPRCVFVRHQVGMRPVSQEEQYHILTVSHVLYIRIYNIRIHAVYIRVQKTISSPYKLCMLNAQFIPTYFYSLCKIDLRILCVYHKHLNPFWYVANTNA